MKLRLISLFAVFVIVQLIFAVMGMTDIGNAETVTLQINPIDDTYVDKTEPNTNFGADTQLVVGKDTWTKFCFLKFDISLIPKGVHIVSVELKLFCYDISTTSGSIIVGKESLLDEHGWSESSLTYAVLEEIAESYGAHIGGSISGFKIADFSNINEWSWVGVNLTDSSFPNSLEENRGNDLRQVTLHINLWSGNGELVLCSKEFGSESMRPMLVVTYEKIPTTFSLQPIGIDITEGETVEIWGATSVEPSYWYLEKWLPVSYLGGVVITLEYEVYDSSGYRTTFERRVTTDSTGEFVDEFTPTIIGEYHVKALWDGTDIYSSALSNEIQFNVLESIDWQLKFDDAENQFYNARNLMYIFIVTTIVFIVTSIYFAIRRSKAKLELNT